MGTYASNENCGGDTPAPFVMTINGVCDAKDTKGIWSDHAFDGSCTASVTYTGAAGCVKFNGNAVWEAIKPFSGVILILIGGIMTFYGAKFLFQLVSAFVTLITTAISYLIISNCFFGLETGAGPKIGLMIAAILLGLGAAYASCKFTTKWAVSIVAGAAGGFGFKLLGNLAGVRNEYAVIGILMAGIIAGSYILIRGAGFFFGGFPDEASDVTNVNVHELKGHDKIVWYFVSFIVFFIAGSVVQYKLFHHDDELK